MALRCRQMAITSSSPQGHFLFLPFDNSLLLKSIAVKELMLPSIVQSSAEKPGDNALSVVASCLDQVTYVLELAEVIVATQVFFHGQSTLHNKYWIFFKLRENSLTAPDRILNHD